MAYLLDNNILSYFWNEGHESDLGSASQKVDLAICEEVHDEAARKLGAKKLQEWLQKTRIRTLSIEVGSKAHTTLKSLHPQMGTLKDLGERASIALCAHDPSLVFVANDKKALWLALRELHVRGERIVGLLVFLRRLHEEAGLSTEAIDAIVNASTHTMPTWWRDFRPALHEETRDTQAGRLPTAGNAPPPS